MIAGKINAVISVAESIFAFAATYSYNQLYEATLYTQPAAFMLLNIGSYSMVIMLLT